MARTLWHILLIDDSADDRADLRQMLLLGGSRRYRFSKAELGAQGVRMALDPARGPIDCVMLDYCLPDMDAPEVPAALCNGAGLAPWPVVVITGSAVEERSGLLSAGAQDYIGKRWTSPESLTRAVENAIERFALQAALIAAKAEAEAANHAKSDFLLAMSHELRSPLSAMLGFAQLIEAGKPVPTPAQQDSVQQILRAGWYLLGLINEILDLNAIESGQLAMSLQPLSVNEVLHDCQALLLPQAQSRSIEMTFPPPDRPCLVHADPIRTKQVLINLLSNAIKYNRHAGRITVRCADTPDGRVRVSVEDTGPGLSAAQVAQLFQPFNRLGQDASAAHGTGIGLVICKRLVELMGGHIGAQSTVGVGSCFWFELNAAAQPPPATGILPLYTVLCVEHNQARLRRIEDIVARWPGACLLRAGDLRAGIKIARTARPDVILMGIHAPDSHSTHAMRRLAMHPATATIPVIALHDDAALGAAHSSLAAGFFAHLTQPMQSDAFAHALDLAFQRTQAIGPRADAEELI